MRSRKNQKQRERGHRHRSGGGIDSSVCQTLKTQEECVVCKWNAKTAKCGKAPVKRVPKEAKPKRVPKAKSGCPVLDKESCDSNPDCLWNAKTKKCRKHAVKKAPAAVKAPAAAPAAAAAPLTPKSPVEIPENRKFREQDLEGADFSGMDLTKVVFFSCNLKNAKFHNADLTGARFGTCDLNGANFSGAKILDAEFSYCYVGELRGAKPIPLLLINSTVTSTRFESCRFSNSNFSGTTFEHCDFHGNSSKDANFSGCKFTPHPTIVRKYEPTLTLFRECEFKLSNFTNADFRGCDFNSNRDDDDFEDCAVDERCGNAFNGSVFTGAKFPEKVNMCSFADAVLTGSDISDPTKNIQGCYFDEHTEAEDVEELKRRAIPPDDDEDWVSPLHAVKQKSPSPVAKPRSPSPSLSPVKKAASPAPAAQPAPPSLVGTKCVKQTQKKYLERPSPPYSAADCCGMTLEGNDGKSYISVANAKGVCAWKIVKN